MSVGQLFFYLYVEFPRNLLTKICLFLIFSIFDLNNRILDFLYLFLHKLTIDINLLLLFSLFLKYSLLLFLLFLLFLLLLNLHHQFLKLLKPLRELLNKPTQFLLHLLVNNTINHLNNLRVLIEHSSTITYFAILECTTKHTFIDTWWYLYERVWINLIFYLWYILRNFRFRLDYGDGVLGLVMVLGLRLFLNYLAWFFVMEVFGEFGLFLLRLRLRLVLLVFLFLVGVCDCAFDLIRVDLLFGTISEKSTFYNLRFIVTFYFNFYFLSINFIFVLFLQLLIVNF